MKFPYVPISFAVADVRSEMRQMDIIGDISEEDCLNWAVELLREIGFHNYEESPLIIDIKNFTFQLPGNFYKVKEICLLENEATLQTPVPNVFKVADKSYYRSAILKPADALTMKYVQTGYQREELSRSQDSYLIRYPNQLRVSFRTGKIGMLYLHLPEDSDGNMLMQDEIHTLKAMKAFIKMKLLEEKYYSGQLQRYIYFDIKNDYEAEVSQAQAIFKFNDPADDDYHAQQISNRYNQFRLRD